jgi:hypothetical protein
MLLPTIDTTNIEGCFTSQKDEEGEIDGSAEQLEMEEQSEDDELEIADKRKDNKTEREDEELDEVESVGN